MIFAAGLGTRMGALTRAQPKPMIEVAGKPLIDHALAHCTGRRVFANAHYKPDILQAHLAKKNVQVLHEDVLLETGGGLRAARHRLGRGPVFTMNSDAVFAGPNPLDLLARHWDPDRMRALLLLVPGEAAIGHHGAGDFLEGPDGQLTRGPGLIYTGAQIIETDALGTMPEGAFSLNLYWNELMEEGRVFGLRYPGQWCDVGRPEGIALAENMLGYRDV